MSNKCQRCGFDLPDNQVSDHMESECIRLIAGELHSVRKAAAETAHLLEILTQKVAKR